MNIASLQNLISNLQHQRADTERPERGIALAYSRACAGVPVVVRGTGSTDRPTIHEAETKHRTAEAASESVSFLTLSVEVIQSGQVIPIVPNKPLFINTLIIWSSSNYEDQSDIFGQRMASRELELPSQVRCSSVPGGSRERVEWLDPTNRVLLSIEHRVITKVLEETAPHNDVELQQSFEMRDRHIAPLILALRADLEDGSPAGHLYGDSIITAVAVYTPNPRVPEFPQQQAQRGFYLAGAALGILSRFRPGSSAFQRRANWRRSAHIL